MSDFNKCVDKENSYAIFECVGCGLVSLTHPDVLFADISSSFARFKQTHQECVEGL